MLDREEVLLRAPRDQHRPVELLEAASPPRACSAGAHALEELGGVAPHAASLRAPAATQPSVISRRGCRAWTASRTRSAAVRIAAMPHRLQQRRTRSPGPARRRTGTRTSAAGSSRTRRSWSARGGRSRSGCRVTTIWQSAPPVSLPTSVTFSRSSAARKSAISFASAGRREVGVRVHRRLVRAERPVGRDAAEVLRQLRHDLAPEVAVDEQAVDEHDRLAGPALAVADGALGERAPLSAHRAASERTSGYSFAVRRHRLRLTYVQLESPGCHTYSLYLTYIQYECQDRKAEQSEATRSALIEAARGLFSERGYAGVSHRGDRAARRASRAARSTTTSATSRTCSGGRRAARAGDRWSRSPPRRWRSRIRGSSSSSRSAPSSTAASTRPCSA